MNAPSYKAALTAANTALAADPARLWIGYGLRRGRAGGTLAGVPESQILETPVAENLMVGLAIGAALRGRKPVVYFERADFLLNALDAIVNHLNAIPAISHGEFSPAVILRIVVGNSQKPLFTGKTHTQDFSSALEEMVDFPVHRMLQVNDVHYCYAQAETDQLTGTSSALFEYKDLI